MVKLRVTQPNVPPRRRLARFSEIPVTTLPDGRFTVLMPHMERVHRNVQMSWTPAAWTADASPWLRVFQNARRWVG